MKMRPLIVLALVSIAGCVPQPMRVDTPRVEAADKSYTLDLPVGWIRQFTPERNMIASRDGFPLQSIAVVKRVAPKTSQRATPFATHSPSAASS